MFDVLGVFGFGVAMFAAGVCWGAGREQYRQRRVLMPWEKR